MTATPKKSWRIDKITHGTINELSRWQTYQEYADIILRLEKTELPDSLKLRISPEDEKTIKRASTNLQQWIYRTFGRYYAVCHAALDEKGWYVMVFRGRNWYRPDEREMRLENQTHFKASSLMKAKKNAR
jgi:hypothetical protein